MPHDISRIVLGLFCSPFAGASCFPFGAFGRGDVCQNEGYEGLRMGLGCAEIRRFCKGLGTSLWVGVVWPWSGSGCSWRCQNEVGILRGLGQRWLETGKSSWRVRPVGTGVAFVLSFTTYQSHVVLRSGIVMRVRRSFGLCHADVHSVLYECSHDTCSGNDHEFFYYAEVWGVAKPS